LNSNDFDIKNYDEIIAQSEKVIEQFQENISEIDCKPDFPSSSSFVDLNDHSSLTEFKESFPNKHSMIDQKSILQINKYGFN
jgi:hypothetical protein